MTDRPGAGGEAVEVDEVEQVAARRARRGAEEEEGCGGRGSHLMACFGLFLSRFYSVGVIQTARGADLEIISSSKH